jgi:5-methylcytosine-specific restriction endonuclease McrA
LNCKKMTEPMKLCPRYERCNAPLCPLDPDQELRTYLPGEPKCTLGKARRLKLGESLPRLGMTKREWSTHNSWNALSESQKASKRADFLKKTRLSRGFSSQEGEDERTHENGPGTPIPTTGEDKIASARSRNPVTIITVKTYRG